MIPTLSASDQVMDSDCVVCFENCALQILIVDIKRYGTAITEILDGIFAGQIDNDPLNTLITLCKVNPKSINIEKRFSVENLNRLFKGV